MAAGVRLDYAVEPEPLDTAGAIAFAAAHAGIDETFIVVNGDVLTDVDTSALVAFHRAHGNTQAPGHFFRRQTVDDAPQNLSLAHGRLRVGADPAPILSHVISPAG